MHDEYDSRDTIEWDKDQISHHSLENVQEESKREREQEQEVK